jgi:hypothetical protein
MAGDLRMWLYRTHSDNPRQTRRRRPLCDEGRTPPPAGLRLHPASLGPRQNPTDVFSDPFAAPEEEGTETTYFLLHKPVRRVIRARHCLSARARSVRDLPETFHVYTPFEEHTGVELKVSRPPATERLVVKSAYLQNGPGVKTATLPPPLIVIDQIPAGKLAPPRLQSAHVMCRYQHPTSLARDTGRPRPCNKSGAAWPIVETTALAHARSLRRAVDEYAAEPCETERPMVWR